LVFRILMASNVVHLYLVELDCFIALLSALLFLWWSSILLNLFFCFMVCVVEVCLLFFSAFDFGVVCCFAVLFHGLCCRSLSCCFWFDFENGVFCFAVFDLWFAFSYYCGSLISWGCFVLVSDFSLRVGCCLFLFVHCVESCYLRKFTSW